jgi:phosphoenolpyruvate-protein phosphotransferase (PTS system enzyme I)
MAERRLVGRPAAGGFACGPLAPSGRRVAAAVRVAGTPDEERARLSAAIAAALGQLEALLGEAEGDGADILAFQVAMLEDPELADPAFVALDRGGAAEAAWDAALARQLADYEASDNPHFRARASDIADIRDRVLATLAGAAPDAAVAPGSIVLARDLSPSRFLATDWSRGGAIALSAGSAHGHVATLARARGVPMIVGLGVEPETAEAGALALIDGAQATLWLDPAPATRAAFEARASAASAASAAAATYLTKPARTQDGVSIAVLMNVASPSDLDGLDPAICDGVGLVRTEFLFEGRREPPDEDAQFEVYARIANWAAGRPVTIRTLDAGGDKPIPGLTLDGEANPFLGLRGVRLSLARPDVFRPQLRALCRAAALGPVEVMLPMVALAEELTQAAAWLDEEYTALRASGVAARRPALGIMVETPAAAIAPDLIDADFYSIGSNDLTQYVLAAARDSEAVAALYDPSHPAVLRLIAGVAAHGAARARKVSLCGDAGGDPRRVESLLRAGLRALSVAPSAIATVKQAIAAVDLSDERR